MRAGGATRDAGSAACVLIPSRPPPPPPPLPSPRSFTVPPRVVAMALERLKSDDVYGGRRVYPAPEHRSSALAAQAPLLYVILYLSPRTLHEDRPAMREFVAGHFRDNW